MHKRSTRPLTHRRRLRCGPRAHGHPSPREQGNAEAKLLQEQPERFPPAASKYLWEAVSEWRSGKSQKSLLTTIRAKFDELDQEKKAPTPAGPSPVACMSLARAGSPCRQPMPAAHAGSPCHAWSQPVRCTYLHAAHTPRRPAGLPLQTRGFDRPHPLRPSRTPHPLHPLSVTTRRADSIGLARTRSRTSKWKSQ